MEIEASPAPVVAKKLWNIIRIVMIMLRKGIAKSKAVAEFHLLLKRGKLAIANTLTLHHRHFAAAAFTCHRPNNNNLSFLSPHEYEFSCSNSPAKNHHHHCHCHRRHSLFSKRCKYDNVLIASAVQRVLETLDNNNNGDVVVEGGGNYSPFVALPGVGKSPIGKQLRITDSPFPLKEEEGDDGGQVDMAAEEFIKRFYKNLNSQHNAMDSPYYNYHNYSWDR